MDNIVVLVRFETARAQMLAWKRALKPPRRGSLRPPMITENTLANYPPGAGEILVVFYDRNWRRITSYGMWARADYFGDAWGSHARAPLSGGMVPPRFDDRAFHLSIPDGAAYIAFFRSRVEPAAKLVISSLPPPADGPWGRTQLNLTFLGAYVLPGITPPRPPRWIPWPFGKALFELTAELLLLLWEFINEGWFTKPILRNGWVDSVETLHGTTETIDTCFNIIIMGEGFKSDEMDTFDYAAKTLMDQLLDIEPYKSLSDSINIFLVRAVSYDSGITRCWETTDCDACSSSSYTELKTYFEVEGCWVNDDDPACIPSSPSYLGTEHADWVYAAGEKFAPYEDVDLYVVLANSTVYGGSSFRSQKISFVPLTGSEDMRFKLFTHEIAHVIADIVEEYTPPLPWDGSEHDNAVSRDKREDAWWKAIAKPSELSGSSGGSFKYVVDCPDDPEVGPCDASYNSIDGTDSSHLGLYWGAQFIDADEDPCSIPDICSWDAYTDSRGNNFFRAMARCRMRSPNWDYCRACEEKIREAILAQTT